MAITVPFLVSHLISPQPPPHHQVLEPFPKRRLGSPKTPEAVLRHAWQHAEDMVLLMLRWCSTKMLGDELRMHLDLKCRGGLEHGFYFFHILGILYNPN